MDYVTRALIEAVLAGALAGLVGVLVVLRDRAFFTMALTHATFPGAVVATMLGLSAVAGAAVASIGLVGLAAVIGRIRSQGSAVASGIMLTAGFALGALAQSLATVPVDVESFLVGSILTTSTAQLWGTGAVLAIAASAWMLWGTRLVFSSFDPRGYAAAGMRPVAMELLSLALVALTVVTIMPAVGAILGVALIVAPAAAARRLTGSVAGMLVAAPLIGIACAVAGIAASRWLGVSPGGAITLLAAAAFCLSTFVPRRSRRLATVEA